MITKDEYELRMSELSSTINGRLAAVISKQAQYSVANVYQSTQYKLQPPVSANFDRRLAGTIVEIEKTINYPSVVIEVIPTVTYVNGKVVIQSKNTAYLYKSRTDKTEVGGDSSFVNGKSVSDFPSLRKFLSETTAGAVSDTFSKYLKTANASLKSSGAVVEKAIVYIVDNIQIQQDEEILSPTPTQTTKPINGTSGIPTNGTSGIPAGSNVSSPVQEIGSSGTSGNSFTPFLDVESVDQLLTRDGGGSKFFSPIMLDDNPDQLLTRDDSSATTSTETRDTESVKKTSVDFESSESISTAELDRQQQREYEQQLQVTEAQRLAEFSDALTKEQAKPKSSVSPVGTNPTVQSEGGREATADSAAESEKPPKKEKQEPKAKYFKDWVKKEGNDPNGIIYRGTKPKDYAKGTTPKNTYGMVTRYKNLFNWGLNLGSIFSGYTINSPVDVALLLNSGAIGLFNKNIPYLFDEGCETHLAITRASNVIRKDEGGVGDFNTNAREYLDANWAANPHWCGLCTNFMLYTNGQYKADSNLANITSTASIHELYKTSPFNTVPTKIGKKERARLERRLDELKADTTATNNVEISNIEAKLNDKVVINEQNSCVLLKHGYHWSESGILPDGVDILKKIAYWPGAFIVRRAKGKTSGHVETLLHITKTGVLYTIGGNTGLEDSNGNGSEYGFKKYNSIREFCGSGYDEFYIYKRGTLNPYTNGIGVSVKKTETYNKYVKDLDTDKELSTAAYNILRDIMEK